jgi:hypothetical protein
LRHSWIRYTDGEDHAPDALRYGLMSRPAPKAIPVVVNASSDFDARSIMKWVETRRKSWGYIGNETEAMRFGKYFTRK